MPHNDKPCLPLPTPHRLLAFATVEEDEEDLEKKFRSPTRYLGLVNQSIHKLFASVQGTREWRQVPYEQRNYSWNDLEVFRDFYQMVIKTRPVLSFDIETLYDELVTNEEDKEQYLDKDTVIRFSFSTEPYQALSVPATGYFLDIAQSLLEDASIPKLGWNIRNFDNPVLYKQNGIEVRGEMIDGMDIAHVVKPDLERGLEDTSAWLTVEYPWKHLSKLNEELYSCIDSDVALRNYLSAKDHLERRGMWEKVHRHFVQTNRYLDIAHRNGVPLNVEAQKKLSIEFREMSKEKTLEMQDLVPDHLKRRKLYVKQTQEDWVPVQSVGKERYCSVCGKVNVNSNHPCVKQYNAEITHRDVPQTFYYKPTPKKTEDYEVVKKWLENNGFNPNSAEQVKSYAKIHHHPLAKNWKTDADSLDTKHMEKLHKIYGKEHPIYSKIVDSRKLNKALTSFVDGWKPDERGTITTTYGNAPMSLRFSSRNVNLQQVSNRETNPYAIRSRELICARPGYVLVGADSTAIEAVMSGFYMGDPDYIKAAKQDIHSYVTAKHLGLKFDPKFIKKNHNDMRDVFKRVNHALNYGATPYMIHMTNPDVFPTIKDAKNAVDSIFKSLPKLADWHKNLREEAQETEKLENAWGYQFDFHDVYSYKTDEFGQLIIGKDHKPVIHKGKDFNRVIAIKPQSSAAIFARENVCLIGEQAPPEWLCAILTIHDGYYLHVPDNESDIHHALNVLESVLTRKVPEMDNLTFGCELSVGKDWYNMNKVKQVDML